MSKSICILAAAGVFFLLSSCATGSKAPQSRPEGPQAARDQNADAKSAPTKPAPDMDDEAFEPQDNFAHPANDFQVNGISDYSDKAGLRDRLNAVYKQKGFDLAKLKADQITSVADGLFKQGNFADARLFAKDAGDLDPAFEASWYIRA